MQTPFFSLLVLTLATVQVSPAQQFVSPSERSALEGSSYTHYPLGRASARVHGRARRVRAQGGRAHVHNHRHARLEFMLRRSR